MYSIKKPHGSRKDPSLSVERGDPASATTGWLSFKWLRAFLIALGISALSACGGGSGGGGTNPDAPAPPEPSSEDVANASASQLNVLLKADSKEVVITWVDSFAAESGYRVERQSDGGAWEIQESLPATPATGVAYSWQRVVDRSATYRVVAERSGYVVPLQTQSGHSNIPINLATLLELAIDQQSAVRGIAQVSVNGASSAQSVQYFVDLISAGASSTGPSFAVSWDTRDVADGNHLLLAHVTYGSGARVELRRSVAVDNPGIAVSLLVQGTYGTIKVVATPTSDAGVKSVEFFLNGASIDTLTAPLSNGQGWMHYLNALLLPPGPVTIKVIATDNLGEQAEASRQVIIDNIPELTLEEPIDGAIVSGVLDIHGSVADDLPGTVVSAWLGDVLLFETTDNPIVRSYPLTGIPSGEYTLGVGSRDSAGQVSVSRNRAVIVSSVTAFNYELVGVAASQVTLLDSEGDKLLYRLSDRTVRLRQSSGVEVMLEGAADLSDPPVHAREGGWWHVSGDYATTSSLSEVYLFDSLGRRQPIPHPGFGVRSDLHGSWLVWGDASIYMRNLATQAADVGPIQGDLIYGHAFIDTPGSEQLFFNYSAIGSSSIRDMFVYNLAGGGTTQLSGSDGWYFRPQTDGARIAWEKAAGGLYSPFELRVAPVNNPTAVTVRSTTMSKFILKDGILAWTEAASNAVALRIDDGMSVVSPSLSTSTVLYSNSNGTVVFGDNGKLYAWSAAQGRRLLFDTLPKQFVHDGNVIFITTGLDGATIYRTAL